MIKKFPFSLHKYAWVLCSFIALSTFRKPSSLTVTIDCLSAELQGDPVNCSNIFFQIAVMNWHECIVKANYELNDESSENFSLD